LEAKHFLSVIDGFLPDYKYAINVEVPTGQSGTKTSSNIRLFSNYLILNNSYGIVVPLTTKELLKQQKKQSILDCFLVETTGIEPATPCVQGRCSPN
jgi:hypothetical protein